MRLRFIKRIIIFAILISVISTPCLANAAVFQDINGHWAQQYVMALVEKGAVSGMPDGLFHPGEKMTFPQFVTIIIATEYGKQTPTNSHWASGYMELALDKGLIVAEDIGKTGDITRYEAVRLVYSALSNIYYEEEAPDIMSEPDFADFTSCRLCQESYGYARQCHVKGIVNGRPSPDGPVFDGNSSLTRAEGCVIIMKMQESKLRTPPDGAEASQRP